MSGETTKAGIPAKFEKLVSEIEKMSVLDLSELVKVLEEKFGVSAAAPMMAMPMDGDGGEGVTVVEEKSSFNVEVKSAGEQKIQVIKVLREATGLGLAEAKGLVDAAPKVVKEGMPKAEAEELKKKLEDAGATVELK